MEVEFTPQIPTPIKQKGIEIKVFNTPGKGGNLLGTLTVTQTRLVWRPRGAKVKTNESEWEDFIEYMESL